MEVSKPSNFPPDLKASSGKVLLLDKSRLLLGFKTIPEPITLERFLHQYELVLEDAEDLATPDMTSSHERVNHTAKGFWVRSRTKKPIESKILQSLHGQVGTTLEFIGPVYFWPHFQGRQAFWCPLPFILVITPTFPVEENAFIQYLKTLHLEERVAPVESSSKSRIFVLAKDSKTNVYELPKILEQQIKLIREVSLEWAPMLDPAAYRPTDPLYGTVATGQWNMRRISAGEDTSATFTGWDVAPTRGNTVIVAVIDHGCALHPDLKIHPSKGVHFELDAIGGLIIPGLGTSPDPASNSHGTACAGIIAATMDNLAGVAGVAGNATILPVIIGSWSALQIAAGIDYAVLNNANVINMSFGIPQGGLPTNSYLIDNAINTAHMHGVLLCAATNNDNGPVHYPAAATLVMACGASNTGDARWTNPTGEGSNYGPEISVVAPGENIPTTANPGWGDKDDGSTTTPTKDYLSGVPIGPGTPNVSAYEAGTSLATPHISGLAALLFDTYPGLSNVEVRTLIERNADKVGSEPYLDKTGYPSGSWNPYMGYGRINVFHALNCADVMIRDWAGDDGLESSSPPGYNYWDSSDIVIRQADDNTFLPLALASSSIVQGDNWCYVRVVNNGPAAAKNVTVKASIWPRVTLSAINPIGRRLSLKPLPQSGEILNTDTSNADHAEFSVTITTPMPAHSSRIVKFSIDASTAQYALSWARGDHDAYYDAEMGWGGSRRPMIVFAEVTSDNDYPYQKSIKTGADLVMRRNNLAQRKLRFPELP
jgi:subtilisin family serine protease